MLFEQLVNDAPLNAPAATVYEPDFAQANGVGLDDVLFNYRWDVAGRERVEVQHALDWNPKRGSIYRS